MIQPKPRIVFRFNIAIAALTLAYLSWQLIGLRFTNHDDIYFHLYSHFFSNNYLDFARNTALKQARIQAFLNMPIVLWADSFQNSIWFDVINITNLIFLLISIFIFLRCLLGLSASLLLITVTTLTFPLHYYFTFPQGYPVMGSYGLALAFLAASLFVSHLKIPKTSKLIGSAALFTLSLWGPEYNFILHPAFLLLAFFSLDRAQRKAKNLYILTSPYVVGWLISVGSYLLFSIISRNTGGDANGRVSFGFNAVSWLKTFLTLEEKAFLPAALYKGITIPGTHALGISNSSIIFNYAKIWRACNDWHAIAPIFFISIVFFFALFQSQRLSKKSLAIASVLFIVIAIIPALIVSLSSHYQKIVLAGWLQGHLVTFYAHLGLSGLLFLLTYFLINKIKAKIRLFALVIASIIFASYTTATAIYNNTNRQIMMANKQKWDAMNLLTSYIKDKQPEIINSQFYAPDFWSDTGVSSIPENSPFNGENYWALYSDVVLNQKLRISKKNPQLDDGIGISYFPTPGSGPVIYMEDYGNQNIKERTLISLHPISGRLMDTHTGRLIQKIRTSDWACDKYCTIVLPKSLSAQGIVLIFKPADLGPKGLLSQIFMERYNGYGIPNCLVGDNLSSLRVESWGPQETVAGITPNPQPSGGAGIWIKFKNDHLSKDLQVTVDDHFAEKTNINGSLITASVEAKAFATPGKRKIAITSELGSLTKYVGEIVVRP